VHDQTSGASVEVPNSLKHAMVPPYAHESQPELIMMLLRNLAPGDGLCNGTRLIVRRVRAGGRLQQCVRRGADASEGCTVLIPRVDNVSPDDNTFGFIRMRR